MYQGVSAKAAEHRKHKEMIPSVLSWVGSGELWGLGTRSIKGLLAGGIMVSHSWQHPKSKVVYGRLSLLLINARSILVRSYYYRPPIYPTGQLSVHVVVCVCTCCVCYLCVMHLFVHVISIFFITTKLSEFPIRFNCLVDIIFYGIYTCIHAHVEESCT